MGKKKAKKIPLGDFYLRGTLAFPEGWYSVSQRAEKIEVRGRQGRKHSITPSLFAALRQEGPTQKAHVAASNSFFVQDEGVLSALGYHVGEHGLRAAARHQVLHHAFLLHADRLPRVGDQSYRKEWGAAASQQRLRKMVDCLTSFAANARNRRRPTTLAIDDWESDLEWIDANLRHT